VTKRKKSTQPEAVPVPGIDPGSITTQSAVPVGLFAEEEPPSIRDSERTIVSPVIRDDVETTVNVTGDMLPFPGRDDLDAPTVTVASEALGEVDSLVLQRKHLRGLLEALIFASDSPIKSNELAKLASAPVKVVKEILEELHQDFLGHGIHLEEIAGGWVFRTSAQYAPFIRDLTKQRPVRLSRAQVETLAIIAYRQPMTRPEVDDVRGVDSGPVLKVLLERDLVRILGKRDEVGRPLIYGTTTHFLEFFGLKSLKDLPTLREFTELTDESREKYEEEIGEPPNEARPPFETAPDLEAPPDGDHPESLATDPEGNALPADDDALEGDAPAVTEEIHAANDEDDDEDDDDDDDDEDEEDDDDDDDDDEDDEDDDDDDDDDEDEEDDEDDDDDDDDEDDEDEEKK
jgi:segregation and condensation protein B